MIKNKVSNAQSRSIIIITALLFLLSGCDDATQSNDAQPNDIQYKNAHQNDTELASASTETITSESQATIDVDWSNIDSGVSAASLDDYDYPMAIDSDPVKAFAEHQGISLAQAQHNITVGTASNEPLLALFDELGDNYISHSLSDGEDIALVVHTTADVSPSRFDYVLKEDFARGLILPIVIVPDDKNGNVSVIE